MLLHVHKELADGIDKLEVANMFVGGTISGASNCLGSFQKNDLPMKSTFASEANQTV